jgi:Protein of unknown function (DUF2637)
MSTDQLRRGGGRRPDARDWIDQTIEVASGATAVGMFAYGFALSYSVLHAIATAAGLPVWASDVWPLGYEAFMASAALNALAEQRRRRHLTQWWQRVPWYPWTLTGLTAGASLLLNWFHPAIPLDPPPGWLRSLVYGLPPLVAVFAWHLFLQRVAHRHPAPPTATLAADAADPSRPEDAAVPGAPAPILAPVRSVGNSGPAAGAIPRPGPSAPVLAVAAATPASGSGNGQPPAGPATPTESASAEVSGATGSPGPAPGGNGRGERDADTHMRTHWAAERTAGRTPSGAELDRVCGRNPRNGAGRKARARYLREEAAGRFHAPQAVPVPASEPATANSGPGPADGPAAPVDVPVQVPAGRLGGGDR